MKRSVLLAASLLFLASISAAYAENADEKYYALVDKAVSSDLTAQEWLEIRQTYQETSFYMGQAGDIRVKTEMPKLAEAATSPETHAVYRNFARNHFALFSTHFMDAAMAINGKGGFTSADKNMRAVDGLLNSVEKSGDGKSCDTSMYVIDVGEEYMILKKRGLKPNGQTVINGTNRICDKLSYIDSQTNEKGDLYFDISKLLATPIQTRPQ